MLTGGQLSDRIGRKAVLLGALATLAVAQAVLITEPDLEGLLIARAIQGLATGAFFGTCTAFLVDAAPPGRTPFVAVLGSVSVRLGLGFGPGIGGVIAQYSDAPLRLPFELHLIAIALARGHRAHPAGDGDRPLAPAADAAPGGARRRAGRLLAGAGALGVLFSLFDGVALSLIPVFLVRTLDIDNYALVGAAGFLVLVSGAVSQLAFPRLAPDRAIGWGLAVASLASVGVVLPPPARSAALALCSVAVTGGAAGPGLQGGHRPVHPDRAGPGPRQAAVLLLRRLLPGRLLGAAARDRVLSDVIGLTAALAVPVGARGGRGGLDLGRRPALAVGARGPGAGAGAPHPPDRRVDSTGPMALQASDPEALAATLLEADRAVVLTGLRLGGAESLDLTHVDGQWAERASLEAFLTDPARFWEYFYPTALLHRRAPAGAGPRRPRPARAGRRDRRPGHPGGQPAPHQGRQPRPGRGLRHRPHPALRALRGALRPARGGRAAGGLLGRGAALHHPRLRLPPAARGHPLGRDPAARRRSSGPGSWPPTPTPSSSSTRTCARRRSRCCPRSRSPGACRWCSSARPPPSTTATPTGSSGPRAWRSSPPSPT